MAKFKGSVNTGYNGCDSEFTFEIEDNELKDMSEEDIEKIAFECMCESLDWWWGKDD